MTVLNLLVAVGLARGRRRRFAIVSVAILALGAGTCFLRPDLD